MVRTTEIKLPELTDKAVTRIRGDDAAKALSTRLSRLKNHQVVINLSGLDLISTSFIDELTRQCKILENNKKVKIIYRIDNKNILKKIARASGFRDTPIQYFWRNSNKPIEVKPIPPKKLDVIKEDDIPDAIS